MQMIVILALAYQCSATGYMSDAAGARSARQASGSSKPRSSSYGGGEQSVSRQNRYFMHFY